MKKFLLLSVISVFLLSPVFAQWTCGDTLTDLRDGQKYPTVLIGNQCWMAKNLNVGIMIHSDSLPSDNSVNEKFCFDNDTNNCVLYGGLYSWNEMMNYSTQESVKGICPDGWYIPSDAEVKELEIALGMDPATADLTNTWRGTDQGTQMLQGGGSGLEFLFAGGLLSNQAFFFLGQFSYFHTSTESGTNAWRRCLYYQNMQVGRFNTFPKSFGLSVRCIKGDDTTTVGSDINSVNQLLTFTYFNREVVVFSQLPVAEKLTMSMFDISGRVVFVNSLHQNPGDDRITVKIPNLSPGMYIISIQTTHTGVSGKIVIY